jgi:hypothetical protein
MRTLPAGKRLQQWRRFLEFGLSEYAGALKAATCRRICLAPQALFHFKPGASPQDLIVP